MPESGGTRFANICLFWGGKPATSIFVKTKISINFPWLGNSDMCVLRKIRINKSHQLTNFEHVIILNQSSNHLKLNMRYERSWSRVYCHFLTLLVRGSNPFRSFPKMLLNTDAMPRSSQWARRTPFPPYYGILWPQCPNPCLLSSREGRVYSKKVTAFGQTFFKSVLTRFKWLHKVK